MVFEGEDVKDGEALEIRVYKVIVLICIMAGCGIRAVLEYSCR